MTKKAIRTKELRLTKSVVRPLATTKAPTVESVRSSFADAVLTEASQTLSSEERALDFLVSSITEKLGSEGVERTQMHEFLNLILETDPALKEEIMQEISPRK